MNHKQAIQFILSMIKSFPKSICVMFLVAVIWAIDVSLRPYIIKIILNRITITPEAQVFTALTFPVLAYLGSSFFMTSLFRVYNYFIDIKMIPLLRKKIAASSVQQLLEQSHRYYQDNFAGSLSNKINDLTGSIPDLLQIFIDRFLAIILSLLVAIFTLWQVNYRFAFFMFLWASVFIFGGYFFSKKISRYADIYSEWGSTITGKVVDVLSNILSVRLFARKSAEKNMMNEVFDHTVKAEQKMQWGYFWLWFFYGNSFVVTQAFNFYFLLKGREQGWITVGDFSLVLMINFSIVEILWQMTREFTNFSRLFGKVTQALRTIQVVSEIKDKPNAKSLVITEGKIIFDQVHFKYQEKDILFANKSVVIPAGQKVGLVGYSGSGKTTFVNLILRLFEIHGGEILIDDQNISDVTQDSLREAIAMIPQDPALFHRSLMDNIRYGKIEASDDEVILAAKKAHAHDFIIKIPESYQALVGERGIKLSGGQRQRIAIARAILKNAPILILDEATSQLDSVTESDIQDSLWELMQNKTTIVIAHRLSTLLHMDRILVFDQGNIVEDGTHQSLLEQKGLYKILWDAQVGGFLPENIH